MFINTTLTEMLTCKEEKNLIRSTCPSENDVLHARKTTEQN